MLPYRIIPNNLCSYNPFKEVEVNSLEWTAFSNWFQIRVWSGRRLYSRETWYRYNFGQLIKVNITSDKTC